MVRRVFEESGNIFITAVRLLNHTGYSDLNLIVVHEKHIGAKTPPAFTTSIISLNPLLNFLHKISFKTLKSARLNDFLGENLNKD